MDLTEKTFDFAVNARQLFAKGNLDDKRKVLKTIGLNLFLRDGKLMIQAQKPFEVIVNKVKNTPVLSLGVEPEKVRDVSVEKGNLSGGFEEMWAVLDSNQRPLTYQISALTD